MEFYCFAVAPFILSITHIHTAHPPSHNWKNEKKEKKNRTTNHMSGKKWQKMSAVHVALLCFQVKWYMIQDETTLSIWWKHKNKDMLEQFHKFNAITFFLLQKWGHCKMFERESGNLNRYILLENVCQQRPKKGSIQRKYENIVLAFQCINHFFRGKKKNCVCVWWLFRFANRKRMRMNAIDGKCPVKCFTVNFCSLWIFTNYLFVCFFLDRLFLFRKLFRAFDGGWEKKQKKNQKIA